MDEPIKYEEAVAQLEQIVRKMEKDEVDIDKLAAEQKKEPELRKI